MSVGENVRITANPELTQWFYFYNAADDYIDGAKQRVITAQYIWPYQTELSSVGKEAGLYSNRLTRSFGFNITEPILMQHHTSVAQELTIEGFEDEAILSDVTGYGCDAQQALSERLWLFLSHGLVGTLVEGPEIVASTEALAQAANERSYQVIYPAQSILDCQYFEYGERRGQIRRVLLAQKYDSANEKEVYDRLREYIFVGFDDGQYRCRDLKAEKPHEMVYAQAAVSSIDGSVAGSTQTLRPLNYDGAYIVETETYGLPDRPIPFVAIGKGPCDSATKNLWPLNQALNNEVSVYGNVVYQTGFDRVIFTNVDDPASVNNISEYGALFLRGDIGVNVIPAGDPSAVQERIKMILQWVQRINLFQFNQLMDDTRQVQSAESKAKDLLARLHYYNDILNAFGREEDQIYQFMAMFEDKNLSLEQAKETVSVTIGRDYGLEDSDFTLTKNTLTFNWADKFGEAGFEVQKAMFKRMVQEFPIDEEEKTELLDKIEAAKQPDLGLTEPRINGFQSIAAAVNGRNQNTNGSNQETPTNEPPTQGIRKPS